MIQSKWAVLKGQNKINGSFQKKESKFKPKVQSRWILGLKVINHKWIWPEEEVFNGKLKPEVSKISVIFKQSNNLSIERVFKTMNPLEDVSQPVGDELCFLTVGHIPAPIEETALAPLT